MKPYTSFRAGGSARFFAMAETSEEVAELFDYAKDSGLQTFLLGFGSNVVFSDSGFDGLVVKLGKGFSHFKFDKGTLVAKATTPLSMVARMSAAMGLSGMHLLAGIPGSVGGAVAMNAGAYGEDISQTLVEVKILDSDGQIRTIPQKDCGFGYRKSLFENSGKVVLEAKFALAPSNAAELALAQKKIMEERKAKQPLDFPSAGSMFKRPENGFPGALVEQAGLKGFSIGDAQISPKHANFIVNTGNATAQNIYDLSQKAIDAVRESSGITLEREVIFLGKF